MQDTNICLGEVQFITIEGSASINFGNLNIKDKASSAKTNIATGGTYGDHAKNTKIANEVKIRDIDYIDTVSVKNIK